jgi:hypothetical protein
LSRKALPLSAPPFSMSHTQIGAFGLVGAVGALAAARAGHLADRGLGQWAIGIALVCLSRVMGVSGRRGAQSTCTCLRDDA